MSLNIPKSAAETFKQLMLLEMSSMLEKLVFLSSRQDLLFSHIMQFRFQK